MLGATSIGLVAFFSPMRHFRDELIESGKTVLYHELTKDRRKARGSSFESLLTQTLKDHQVDQIVLVQPGDHRVRESIRRVAEDAGVAVQWHQDRSFYCTIDRFSEWADGRKSMILEQFYRVMRKEHDILMTDDGKPVGGDWNYDKDNRGKFGKQGPGEVPQPPRFEPDKITSQVIEMVQSRFADHPR